MFKTDKKSLEELSFLFNEQDIARFKHLLEHLRKDRLSDLSDEEILRLSSGLEHIGSLKLNSRIYAFHVDDSYAFKQGDDASYGVELYRRQGDRLGEFAINQDRDWVLKVAQVIPELRSNKIDIIYTGRIPYNGEFLGLPQSCDKEDPLTRKILDEFEIAEFRSKGINVVVLDSLI